MINIMIIAATHQADGVIRGKLLGKLSGYVEYEHSRRMLRGRHDAELPRSEFVEEGIERSR